MSGGFLVAVEPGLYSRARAAVVELGGIRAGDDGGGEMVQLTDDVGRLFTIFERAPLGTEWEYQEGPFIAGPNVELPDMSRVEVCPFECRWPDLVAQVASRIAQRAVAPIWVLDGDGVLWNAKAVDPDKILL